MIDKKITFRYILAVMIAVVFTWLIHEFAHWLTSVAFGYETIMSLNSVSFIDGENPTDWHRNFVSAAGPLITLLQATIIFLFLNSRNWNKFIYPLLFTAFYMRFLAGAMNFINPNDEGRISAFIGIGVYTLPIIVSGLLFFMLFKVSRKYELDWKFQLVTTLVVMFLASILILSDQFFDIRIL